MEEGRMKMMTTKKKEKRIVVAVDESEESMYALSWCISNLILSQNTKNNTLFLLYVKPPPPVYSSLDPTDEGGKKGWNRDAKNVICAAVERLGADILVMGSHDYGFFKRVLLGSVSDHCARHVKCPVLVVKRPKNEPSR